MPNHVTNRLSITGPLKARKEFEATLNRADEHGKVSEFNFHQTVPQPANIFKGNIDSSMDMASTKHWYGWNVANWGTKWNCYDVEDVEKTTRSIKIQFLTAWGAPDAWLASVSKLFPELKFRNAWKDEGGPSGVLVFQNGECAELAHS